MRNASGGADDDGGWGTRKYVGVGVIFTALLVLGLGAWLAMAKLSGAVIASGHIRVEANRQVVQHPDGGVVGRIMVRDGAVVQAGDVLIRLDGTKLRSELKILENQLAEIMARRGRLEAEQLGSEQVSFDPELEEWAGAAAEVATLLRGQRELFRARLETLEREIELTHERERQFQEQIAGTEAEIVALERQAELIAKELKDLRGLFEQGLAQVTRVLALEREEARLAGGRGNLVARVAQFRGQISQLATERLRLESARREQAIAELRELGFREIEFKEKRLALQEQLSRLEIRAPRPGIVYDMAVHALQAVVRPAEPILYIAPSDTSLVIDARVNPVHIDDLHPHQAALLRFSSFNSRKTPEMFGIVTNISPDALKDKATGESYYLAELKINQGEMHKLGDHRLVPGMPLEVFIQTGERTPLNYLVRPISDYFMHAMREE